MGQQGAREDSPTPQKDQSSKKEEGTMTQIINSREMEYERSSENHNQIKEYRSSQGGQQDKERKGTDLQIPGRITFGELPDGAFHIRIKFHTLGYLDVLLRRANLIFPNSLAQ